MIFDPAKFADDMEHHIRCWETERAKGGGPNTYQFAALKRALREFASAFRLRRDPEMGNYYYREH